MKLRILLHNPKGERSIGKAIVAYTWLLALVRLDFKSMKHHYSHVEAWWPNKYGQLHNYTTGGICWLKREDGILFPAVYGFCFSSTTRGKYKGVRIAPASEVLHNPHRWAYIEIDVTQAQLDAFKAYAESRIGRKYDYWGIFGFFLPFNTQKKADDYCSETITIGTVTAKIIEIVTLGWWKFRISPRRLAKVLSKLYGEPKQL